MERWPWPGPAAAVTGPLTSRALPGVGPVM